MPLPQIPEPRIKFHFEGVIALGASQGRSSFHAGIIKGVNGGGEIPGHFHSIVVKKIVNDVEDSNSSTTIVDPQLPVPVLRLDLGQPPNPGIRLFRPAITSTPAGILDASSHFDWVMDVESKLHGGRNVTAESAALRTVLEVKGLDETHFYAWDVNREMVFIEEDVMFPPPPISIEGAAGSVKAVVRLPAGGAAIQRLDKFGQPINIPYQLPNDVAGLTYEIVIKNVCPSRNCSHERTIDFYNGLIGQPSSGRRVKFVKRPPRLNPIGVLTTELTGCPVVNFGITGALPNPA